MDAAFRPGVAVPPCERASASRGSLCPNEYSLPPSRSPISDPRQARPPEVLARGSQAEIYSEASDTSRSSRTLARSRTSAVCSSDPRLTSSRTLCRSEESWRRSEASCCLRSRDSRSASEKTSVARNSAALRTASASCLAVSLISSAVSPAAPFPLLRASLSSVAELLRVVEGRSRYSHSWDPSCSIPRDRRPGRASRPARAATARMATRIKKIAAARTATPRPATRGVRTSSMASA